MLCLALTVQSAPVPQVPRLSAPSPPGASATRSRATWGPQPGTPSTQGLPSQVSQDSNGTSLSTTSGVMGPLIRRTLSKLRGLGIFFFPPSCEEVVTRTWRWLCAHTDPAGLWQLSDSTAWKSFGVVGHQYNTSVELPEWSPKATPQSPKVLLTPSWLLQGWSWPRWSHLVGV